MSVCVSIYLCSHQSIYLFFFFLSVDLCLCLSTYLSIYLPSFVPVCLSKSVCLSIYLSIGPTFSLCVCLSLFICVSIYLFTCLSVRLASLFSVCQSIYLRLPVCLPVYYNMRHLHRMWCGSTGGPNASRKNTKQTQSWWGQQSVGNPTTFRWHPTLMTPSLASLKSCKSKPKNRGRLDLGLGGDDILAVQSEPDTQLWN